MYKLIFFGTSEFAVPSLEALVRDPRFSVEAVVTQPDRPKGRDQNITPPPIKTAAEKLGIATVVQPIKLTDPNFRSWIEKQGPEMHVFVVASYGKILPKWLLDLPKWGKCVNVHGSLLPRWRGASPVQTAIAAGDERTGVTVMKMDEDLDHGPLISGSAVPLTPETTGGQLHDQLAELGGKILPNILAGYLDDRIPATPQQHDRATFCGILKRENGRIDWNKTAEEIERIIRAYNPWPGAWMDFEGKRLKILGASIRPNDASHAPGERFLWKKKPHVKCGRNTVLELTRIQLEGKKPMSGEEFARGNEWSR